MANGTQSRLGGLAAINCGCGREGSDIKRDGKVSCFIIYHSGKKQTQSGILMPLCHALKRTLQLQFLLPLLHPCLKK